MIPADRQAIAQGALANLVASILAIVVAVVLYFLLQLSTPLPEEGLLSELLTLPLYLVPYMVMLVPHLRKAAQAGSRWYLAFLGGVMLVSVLFELLNASGGLTALFGPTDPSIIPDWLTSLVEYAVLAAVAYGVYARTEGADTPTP